MTHGTTYGYRRHACRCDLCRQANTRAQKARRLRILRAALKEDHR